jgi:O-antigen ligase
VSDALQWLGTAVACGLAAAALVAPGPRARAGSMLGALVLLVPLLLAELWNREELRALRDAPARLVAIGVVSLLLVALLVPVFRRRPEALPVALIAVLPFRVPLGTGGQDANLLAPLYVVIAAGAVCAAWSAWTAAGPGGDGAAAPPGPREESRAVRWVLGLLAASVLVYGLQAAYSADLDKATETAGFFLVPFALMLRLLIDTRWSPRLLTVLLAVVAGEALVLSLVAFGEAATRHLFWNQEVIDSNEIQRYFRVNSLFWDPNIFGRYLAVVIVALAACLLWARERRDALLLAGAAAVLFAAMILTYSQSSLMALLAGLIVLAALRWSFRWTAIVTVAACVVAVIYLAAFGSSIKFKLGSEHQLDKTTSGRADLVRGGVELAGRRPVWGFGSGSFQQSFREESAHHAKVAASHTEPVTIVAEQGAIGLILYVATLVAAFAALLAGMRGLMPGLPSRGPPSEQGLPWEYVIGRAAALAAFTAMFVHSMSYAAFLSDPLTWTLLGLGIVLSRPYPGSGSERFSRSAASRTPSPRPGVSA